MTVQRSRIPPTEPVSPAEVNRSFGEVATGVNAELAAMLFGSAQLLAVPTAEAASTFVFPTTRRLYSAVTQGTPSTTLLRVFTTGETIVRHALGRSPKGRVVVGQRQAGDLFDLDPATLVPPLNPAEVVVFRASVAGLYQVAVL